MQEEKSSTVIQGPVKKKDFTAQSIHGLLTEPTTQTFYLSHPFPCFCMWAVSLKGVPV